MPESRTGNRVVVSGWSGGSHFPRVQADLDLSFTADGTGAEGPFNIDGSVYGRGLHFRGPGRVKGSVLGRGDVQLEVPLGQAGVQAFLGGVNASGNLVCREESRGLRESASASLSNVRFLICGEVIGENVKLQDAVVFGNIDGNRVTLTNCLVLGAVVAREELRIEASTILYYYCRKVHFSGPCMMLNAMGESTDPPQFLPYQDPAGGVWACEVLYYPVLRKLPNASLNARPWEIGKQEIFRSRLSPRVDFLRVEANVRNLVLRGGSMVFEESNAHRHVLSIGGRCLNFEPILDSLRAVFLILRTGLEVNHYSPATRRNVWSRLSAIATAHEMELLGLLSEVLE